MEKQQDTRLVSALYRLHQSLPPHNKINSLYVFDALSRAARQQANKSTTPPFQAKGNCTSFLIKIEGVLDGLFEDMCAIDVPEAKVSCTSY